MLKFASIIPVGIVLLIPLLMIYVLIQEREHRHDEAVREMSSSWAHSQTVSGPLITVPYRHFWKDKNGEIQRSIQYAMLLPAELHVAGHVNPQVRRRGIFSAVLFETDLEITGMFESKQFAEQLSLLPEDVLWEDVTLSLGVSDARGISDEPRLVWNGAAANLSPGATTVFESGMHAPIDLRAEYPEGIPFSLELKLRGSRQLSFIPVGRQTTVEINSTWPDPSFSGAYLPREHKVGEEGFQAKWKVLEFARNYPQRLTTAFSGVPDVRNQLHRSAFGVQLFQAVAAYQQVTRSVKYGILFVGLTFLAFFLFEVLRALQVHPVHYLLVGAALVVFYLLLLSLSEHLGFKYSFLASSVGVIGMITVYSFSFLKVRSASLLLGGILTIFYSYLYVLLQIEDYALLVGSLGVFAVLGTVMYVTRKIDWTSAMRIRNAG